MSYKEVFLSQGLLDSELSLEAIVLYSFVANQIELNKQSYEYKYTNIQCVDEIGFYAIISNQELKQLLRIKSHNTLTRVKKELEEKGMLIQKRTLMGSNKYYIKR